MVYTEFVSSDALIRSVKKTQQKMVIFDSERPVAIQIYGREVDTMAEAAKIAEQSNPDILDLNFGCPVKKVAGKGAGSGMMKEPDKMVEIVKAVVDAVDIPVTVKTRLGWDDDSKIIVELAERLQDVGIQALTVHGRTRCQLYKGEADWTLIGDIKANPRMHIPIIGNGDITTPEKAKEYFERYGVDAVMVGRACVGNPWIFKEIRHYLDTGEKMPEFTLTEKVDILKRQIRDAISWLDERKGILHSRRHLAESTAFKGLSHFRDLRISMLKAETKRELFAIMDEVSAKYGDQTSDVI